MESPTRVWRRSTSLSGTPSTSFFFRRIPRFRLAIIPTYARSFLKLQKGRFHHTDGLFLQRRKEASLPPGIFSRAEAKSSQINLICPCRPGLIRKKRTIFKHSHEPCMFCQNYCLLRRHMTSATDHKLSGFSQQFHKSASVRFQ